MFYTDETQRAVYVAALEQLVDRQPQRPAVLVEPLRNFYRPRHIIRTIW